ncbi:alpha/beta hydrolase family protein [Anthocerotibacter panamensis]|uniref:alpha/beta hydrolase family protein n=1 Tax=Anthocerotibacter panamensis TaxID=2857077 RepID=UPI001C404904|nr:alpha/beta fold hydrolase [Anthocerotibacter panamensis]
MVERFALRLDVEDGALAGELVAGAPPGVVFACGSALADRDGNDQDVGFAPLGQLALQLGDQGVSSLRFDRRGVGESAGNFAGPQQAVEDFLKVVEQAAQLPEIGPDPVLLGHAEGAGMAVVGAGRTAVRGLVLIAPPATMIHELISYGSLAQAALAQAPLEEHPDVLQKLQDEYRARSRPFLFRPVLRVACPVLILHGTMDWVFPPAEAEQIAAELERSGRRVTLEILPGLDHWLVSTRHWRALEDNLSPGWPVDPSVAQRIAHWIWELNAT